MVDLNAIPNVPLKIIFAVHFILTTWAIQGQWSPDSYLFYNFFFLLSLMWGMHLKDSEEPLQFAISINGISILLDLFTLLIFYPSPFGYSDRFSVLMTILNLIFRPISILLLGKICATRMGLSDGGFPARIGEIFGINCNTNATDDRRDSNNRMTAAGGGAVEPFPRA
ncbi:type-1 angiotensin II receptor-associated protein isoform X2 [Lycorma delicatula]|uniref:type-1 angiotensin II receptor-associated protein isoform X2 n=1 Tax=Lycorma delicatula TaxID=130591 RepID=UPI003F5181A7